MASRFVQPETKTLHISNGDWLVVRKRLTAGEQRAAHARMYIAGMDGTLSPNPLTVGVVMTSAYLLDWSLKEHPIRDKSTDDITAALDALDPVDFAEIKDAVALHEAEMRAERAAQKKIQSGEPESSAISPSLAGAG